MGGTPAFDTTKHAAAIDVLRSAHQQSGPHQYVAYACALAAAGLLCTPQERAVIDAAIAETTAEDTYSRTYSYEALPAARMARRVAVAEHKAAS